MNKLLKKIVVLLSAGALFTLSAAPGRGGIPAVRVEKVTTSARSEGQLYVGKIEGSETVEIVARVSGTLWKAAFREGSFVKKGALLFHIEDTIYKENVNAARAALKAVEAQLAYAAKEKRRYEKLHTQKATSETTYESAVRTYELYKAQKMEAAAKLALMENDLSYTKIYSPIDGKIGANIFSEGNYITPGKGVLATVVKYDPVKIKFAMAGADFLRYNKKGEISARGLEVRRSDGVPYKGKIKINFYDNQINVETGTLMIELELENKDFSLIPGSYVTVGFSDVYSVPRAAVSASAMMTDGKKHFVYCVDKNNKIRRREVVPGDIVGTQQNFISGLKAGEVVVTGGMHKVRPGTEVKPVFSKILVK